MEGQHSFSGPLRFFKTVLWAGLGFFILAGLTGWHMPYLYGYGLMWAGVAAVLLGLWCIPGGYGTRRLAYQYARMDGAGCVSEYARQKS